VELLHFLPIGITTRFVKNALIKAIDCWYVDNPSGAAPFSPNWYHNEISLPKAMGPVGLIIQQDLNQTQLNNIVATMPVSAPVAGTGSKSEGANRTDIGLGVIYRGMLLGDSTKVSEGVLTIEDSIILGQGSGYIQSDYSWQQHGPQLYNAGYGISWKESSVDFAYYIRDLQWALPQEKMAIVASYLLDGEQWMIVPGGEAKFDYNTIGRAIGRAQNPSPVVVPLSIIDLPDSEKVAAMVPSKVVELQAYENYRNGGAPAQTGFKHFWRSDYSVVMRDDFMYTIRMSSDDVTLLEHGNGENLLGYWLGFGNTFLYQSGDEYDDIFPVWKWDEIPGVTSAHFTKTRNKEWGYNYQDSTFVGAVTDGHYGVTVMDMVHTDDDTGVKDLFAKKAWFAFEDEIVALGAGISSSRSEYINTTVNQSLLKGPVTVDGVEYAEGSRDLTNVDWIHHDDVGYVFPTSWWGQMSNNTRTGSSSLLDTAGTTDPLSADVFRLRMGHSWQPSDRSYQYIIVPNVTNSETQVYSDATPVTIIENSEEIQAVRHAGLNMTGIVFYKAGSVTVYDGLTVSVSAPSVILLDESGTEPVVSLSTPGTSDTVLVTLAYADKDTYTKIFTTSSSVDELGKTVKALAENELPAPSSSNFVITEFTATDDTYVQDGWAGDNNFGSEGVLTVKEDAPGYLRLTVKEDAPGYLRKSFLRFDLSSYEGTLAEAKLVLDVKAVGGGFALTNYTAYLMENDDWSENTLTYNNAPIEGVELETMDIEQLGIVEWDLTDIVNQEIAGDKIITIKVQSNLHGSADSWVKFFSKEDNNGPKLVLSTNNTVPSLSTGDNPSSVNKGETTSLKVVANDIDGDALTYLWRQYSGRTAIISGEDTDTLTVTAPDLTADEALSFIVTVSDGLSSTFLSVPLLINSNTAPTLSAGDNPSSVSEGETTSLKVVANDIDGDTLTYLWTQTSGTAAIISGADTDTLTVTAPDLTADEALGFTVTISDGMDSTILSIPLLINNNTAPTLSAGDNPSSVNEGETTSLKVVANDIDGDALTYLWTQTSGTAAMCAITYQ